MSSFSPQDLTGEAVLLEPELLLLPQGAVGLHAALVRDGRFARVGPAEELRREHPDLPCVRLERTLLMPGFVDTHHHLTQSFGKSLVFGEPSEIFRRVWVPLEGALDEESGYVAAKLAALESLRGGFTTVVDAGTRMPAGIGCVAQATVDVGIRCVLGLVCNDLEPDGSALSRDEVLAAAEHHLDRWSSEDSLVHPSLAVSIPEVATPATLQALAALCSEHGAVFQTHVNEHLAAVERSLARTGRRPLEALADPGVLGPPALLAHATLLTPTEVALLRDTGSAVSYNPVASAWKGNAVAPAGMFAADGIRFGIGTDGTRSDGFRLMDAAETAQRLAFGLQTGDSSVGAGWTWLEHATGAAADAAGLGPVTGAVQEGLAADYLLVDLDVPELHPSWDLGWELVRLANRDQVTAVVVAGAPRLWKGWPLDWDARALMEEADRLAQKATASAPIHVVHPTSADHRAAYRPSAGAGER
jgi:cytosine/adenosine deaminase-related metal-dependent hydrolase